MTVSVLIPAYNASLYLSECLDSILAQTYNDMQIVVIDDGSTDDTLSIARRYSLADSRVEVYTQPNQGVAVTRNNLLDKATGEYTLFVDADDWIENEMVERLCEIIVSSQADIAMCGVIGITDNQPVQRIKDEAGFVIWERNEFLKKFLFHRELTGSLCNKLVKTSLLHRFTPGITYGEDAMVMWQVLLKANSMAVTHNQYYNYRMNPQSVSHAGGIEKKMSVIPVWESIISNVPDGQKKLYNLARGRFGAEITLILYEQTKLANSQYFPDIQTLRLQLRKHLNMMLLSHVVTLKFLVFAFLAASNWKLAKFIAK